MNIATKTRYLIAALAFVALELFLVLFFDRPVAFEAKQFGLAHPDILAVFRAYTDVGLGVWYAVPSGLGTLLCFSLLRFTTPTEPVRLRLKQTGQSIAYFFMCTSGAGLVTDAIKPLLGRARPHYFLNDDVYGFHPFSFHAHDWNSMPSGHSTTAFAVAFALSALFPRGRVVFLLFAVAVLLSRLMINAHYPSDVVAGMAVAWGVTAGVTAFFRRHGWIFPLEKAESC